jgi:hypothetical protein
LRKLRSASSTPAAVLRIIVPPGLTSRVSHEQHLALKPEYFGALCILATASYVVQRLVDDGECLLHPTEARDGFGANRE